MRRHIAARMRRQLPAARPRAARVVPTLHSLPVGERLYPLHFSRDGSFLLAGGDRKQTDGVRHADHGWQANAATPSLSLSHRLPHPFHRADARGAACVARGCQGQTIRLRTPCRLIYAKDSSTDSRTSDGERGRIPALGCLPSFFALPFCSLGFDIIRIDSFFFQPILREDDCDVRASYHTAKTSSLVLPTILYGKRLSGSRSRMFQSPHFFLRHHCMTSVWHRQRGW